MNSSTKYSMPFLSLPLSIYIPLSTRCGSLLVSYIITNSLSLLFSIFYLISSPTMMVGYWWSNTNILDKLLVYFNLPATRRLWNFQGIYKWRRPNTSRPNQQPIRNLRTIIENDALRFNIFDNSTNKLNSWLRDMKKWDERISNSKYPKKGEIETYCHHH